jgi:hypothetical protein
MRDQWRLADAYSYLINLGSEVFAWEFLRRNSDYQVAHQSIANLD